MPSSFFVSVHHDTNAYTLEILLKAMTKKVEDLPFLVTQLILLNSEEWLSSSTNTSPQLSSVSLLSVPLALSFI